MKITEQEELLANEMYDKLGGLTIDRARAVLKEVQSMLNELVKMMEKTKTIKEAHDEC